MEELELYSVLGEEGFRRLVGEFYTRVRYDDILGPLYPQHEFDAAEERLRDFLIGRFGGPQRYIENRGHPRLRMRHAPFAVTPQARDRWMQLMTVALEKTPMPPEADQILRSYFESTATAMINRMG